MATEIKTWEIRDGKLIKVDASLVSEGLTETHDLEEWITTNPEIIGSDIAIIGRQVQTSSGQLDLLGIDNDGNIIIVELKRDKLPREALMQAIDYASDVAQWDIEYISEITLRHTGKSLEDFLTETFDVVALENITINQTQRILLVGFSIEKSLNRMITWLSDNYGVNINAVVLHYVKMESGAELLSRTTTIPEEVEKEHVKKRSFIPMSDEPGEYERTELIKLLKNYFSGNLESARRIRDVLLPTCLEKGIVTRDELKQAFINYNEPGANKKAGNFISLISVQLGTQKNDFLRQIIEYEYPNNPWEKDNYRIQEGYENLVKEVISI